RGLAGQLAGLADVAVAALQPADAGAHEPGCDVRAERADADDQRTALGEPALAGRAERSEAELPRPARVRRERVTGLRAAASGHFWKYAAFTAMKFVHCSGRSSSAKIAETGQASTQSVQSMQSAGLMYNCGSLSPPWMQSTGQTSTQALSLTSMQGCAMTWVMSFGGIRRIRGRRADRTVRRRPPAGAARGRSPAFFGSPFGRLGAARGK